MKILIVDDSKAMRTFLGYLVAELKLESTSAVDGCDALDVLSKERGFDLALVDWDMPRMNGLQFVQEVRKNRVYDELKLMMVTTQNSLEKVTMALDAGASDFLMKPVTKESLEMKLLTLGILS